MMAEKVYSKRSMLMYLGEGGSPRVATIVLGNGRRAKLFQAIIDMIINRERAHSPLQEEVFRRLMSVRITFRSSSPLFRLVSSS